MGSLLARITNWKTTVMGSALGLTAAAVIGKLLSDAGCDFSTISWSSFVAFAFTQVMGALSTDNGKAVSIALLALFVTACSPIVEVTKIGNEYVQDAHSRKFWWGNWQRVTYCWKLDTNGYCPKDDTRVETHTQIAMDAAGSKAAVGAVSNAPLALGLGLGLSQMQSARMTQSVTGSQTNIPVFESPGTVVH